MTKTIFSKKIYLPLILIIIIYLFELNLFLKTFNGVYLVNKFKNKEIVLFKFINNFVAQNDVHLSAFSNQDIKIYCNKNKYLTHNFDKFGFLNSNKDWSLLNENVILKSYSELNCNDFNLKESKKFFLKSKKNLDLSSLSSGPLHQYSILKEFFENVKTKKVFWLHFEGSDLSDFNNLKNNKLIKYFEDDSFNQNLSFYDISLKKTEIEKHLKKFNTAIFKNEIKNTIFLYRTINLLKSRNSLKKDTTKDFKFSEINDLSQILNKTNIFLREKNIDFIFFYLPRENETKKSLKNLRIKKNLFKALNDNNIKFFDLTEKKYLNSSQKIFLDELIF